MDATAGETAPGLSDEDDEPDEIAEFTASLARVQDRAVAVRRPVRPDYARFAEAHRARPVPAIVPAVGRPLEPALSREECRTCGIPGFRGCAHQAPFVEPKIERASPSYRRYDVDRPAWRKAGR